MIVSGGSFSIRRGGYYGEGPRVEFVRWPRASPAVRAAERATRRSLGPPLERRPNRAPLGKDLEVARMDARRWLSSVGNGVKGAFAENRSILSFEEYLDAFVEAPRLPRALVGAVPPRRPRPLRLRGARDARRQGPPLEALRPAVRARGARAARRRAGGGPGGALPRARHLRALGPRQQAHPAARAERLGEVVDRRRARPRDGGLLADAARARSTGSTGSSRASGG